MNPCDNCEVLQKIEKNRLQWYSEISLQNVKLNKQIMEQRETISSLYHQVMSQRHAINEKNALQSAKDFRDMRDGLPMSQAMNEIIYKKLNEMNNALNDLYMQKEHYEELFEESSRDASMYISFLRGMIDSYRQSLFEEICTTQTLRQDYLEKVDGMNKNNAELNEKLRDEMAAKVESQVQLRYKSIIQSCKEDTDRQSETIVKLRKHNKELYTTLANYKKDFDRKETDYKKIIHDLKIAVSDLKLNNDKQKKKPNLKFK